MTSESESNLSPCSVRELVAYFARLGAAGFGGPIALAGYMQRDLVEERRWISREDYLDGLALAQLSPGPLAAQLAMYIGWVRAGTLGAAAVGAAFVLPSFLMVMALAWAYLRYDGLPWMQGMFYGVGAVVIAIVSKSAGKLAMTTLARDKLLWSMAIGCALVTAWTGRENIALVLACGMVTVAIEVLPRANAAAFVMLPAMWVEGAHGPATDRTLLEITWFFTKAGAFVFGSGLAIVPFLYDGVVHEHAWLTESQFRDAIAVAMITPGPVVITAGFVGYLAAGPVGATLAAAGTFVPPFLVVALAAKRLRRAGPRLKAFVKGVTAAATGAIAGAVFVLGRRAIVDVPTACIALIGVVILLRVKRVPEPALILAAGLVGWMIKA